MIAAMAALAGGASAVRAQAPAFYWSFDADYSSAGTMADPGATAVGDGVSITTEVSAVKNGVGALKIDHSTADADYLSVPVPVFPEYLSNGNAPVAFTVALCYKLDSALGPNDTRNFLFETKPDDALGIGTRSPEEDMEWFLGAVATDATGPIVSDGAWHHVAFVYDKAGTGLITFYHDGEVRDVSRLGLGQFFSDGPFDPLGYTPGDATTTLGDAQDLGMNIGNHRAGDGSRNWQGYMDDFAVWHVALGPAQIKALFDGNYNSTPVSPLTVTTVAPFNNSTLFTFLPNFNPTAVESGWSLTRTINFPGAAGLEFDSISGDLFATRRFQGNDNVGGTTLFGFDGVYKINSSSVITQLAGGDRPAGVALSPDRNFLLWAEDFPGFVYRTPVTGGEELWADGFYPTGDTDPMTLAFVPAGFDGSSFGNDSTGQAFVRPGMALCIDRGNGGADEVYIWDASSANLSVAVNPDMTTTNFDQVLLADGVPSLDGDQIAYDPTTRNSPLINPTDLCFAGNVIYLADAAVAATANGSIWRVTGVDTLVNLNIAEPIRPTAIKLDPITGDLIVLDRFLGSGQTRVLRINPTTGVASTIIAGIGGFTGDSGNGGYDALALSDDGKKLFVSDELMLRIYEFTLSTTPACPADFNDSGTVSVQDIFDFLAAWFAGTPSADFNNSGAVTVQDIFDFLAAWFAGC